TRCCSPATAANRSNCRSTGLPTTPSWPRNAPRRWRARDAGADARADRCAGRVPDDRTGRPPEPAGQLTPLRVVVLGSGTSNGIPVIGCDCAVCQSTDPRDKRTRPSILVEVGDRRVLVDTAPELRLQLVREGVRTLDAVVYTHEHADHIYGLDD